MIIHTQLFVMLPLLSSCQAQAFKGNDNLVEVTFEKCEIRDVGATALATWLCKCESLKYFSLKGNNGLRLRAFTAIANALTRNRNLAVIDLRYYTICLISSNTFSNNAIFIHML